MEITNKIFTVAKYNKYFALTYITGLENSHSITHNFKVKLLSSSKEDARELIKTVVEFEQLISNSLEFKELNHPTKLIVLYHLNVIDAISCGLDVRSKYPRIEMADRFVDGYHRISNEASIFCNDTLQFVIENKEKTSYMKDWRRYDKYNELNANFMLGLEPLTMESFGYNEMDNILEKSKEMLELLIQQNKDNKNV